MIRVIEPEILDDLSPEDPLARGSRRDLRRLNSWMGNVRIMVRALQNEFPKHPPATLIELGAGDGFFLSAISAQMGDASSGVDAKLLDRKNTVDERAKLGMERNGWMVAAIESDVFDWLNLPSNRVVDVMIANLFLHHFSAVQLSELLAGIAGRTNRFICIEPRRNNLGFWSSRMVGLIGCNKVTRHDAPVSVKAGFRANELSALWPDRGGWILEERTAGWCSHLFVARRRSEKAN